MALRMMEGFEARAATGYLSRLYTVSGSLDATTTGRRHGTAAQESNLTCTSRALVGAVENVWVVQFAVRKRLSTSVSTNGCYIELRDSVGSQLTLKMVDAASPQSNMFQFELRRGATVLATSPAYLYGVTTKAWHVFQLKVTIDPSAGTYELKHWDYEGTETTAIAAATGANTANQGTAGADRFTFSLGTGGVSTVDMDDIVVMDGTGGVNDDFTAAPIVVLGELPSADGASSQWTPSSGSNHAALVDDAATLPDGTDEVSSSDVGNVDLFSFTTAQLALVPTASPPTPLGVQVDVEGAIKNSGSATLRVEVRDGADQATDSTDLDYTGSAKTSRIAVMEENPTGTPAPWSMADLLSIQFGVRHQA